MKCDKNAFQIHHEKFNQWASAHLILKISYGKIHNGKISYDIDVVFSTQYLIYVHLCDTSYLSL